ncbi:MAG: hypothetical protein K2Y22_08585 [Candidatus Obscuribacterales bacterium]|nr:hypothetical protein [Candidatus Obscuribacterales bacterium]
MNRTITDIFASVITAIIYIAMSTLVMACIWTAIEAMRQFGVYNQQAMIDQLRAVKIAEDAMRTYDPSSLLGQIESMLKWYNLTFIGAARYGSGLGIFIGAYFALVSLSSRVLAARVAAAIVAGSLVGARLFLMVTSEPKMFIAGACIGAGLFAGVTIWHSRQEHIPDLLSESK